MKAKYFLLFAFITFNAIAQDMENPFKYPLEMDRKSEATPIPGPLNTSNNSPLFFNINISQNAAPQNEPSICFSRKQPNRIVAAWRDFRYGVDPNANRRVGYSYSTNSGLTWSIGKLLDSTILPGLTKNSDPVVTVDTAGNFYISVISLSPSGGNLTLALYKSTDGGVTFPLAYIAAQSGTEDKEWITCDLSQTSSYRNNLYISWTRFTTPQGIKATRSTNGGVNWSNAVDVSTSSNVQGSNICISKNGQVNVTWMGFSSGSNVMFDRSTDGGLTFGSDILISSGPFPDGLPNDVNTFPYIASDNTSGPRSGWLYVVFADNRNGDCDVFFSRSTNNGLNWSSPVRVNNDAIGNGKIQYWPVIAVSELNGNIAIVFMDSRNTQDNTFIEAYLARSYDGGNTFTNEMISSEPSPTAIPGSNVRFGDYIDIDYVGQSIVPVWTDERLGGYNMDIYTAEIDEVLGIESSSNIPNKFELKQNYPNPFNPQSTIEFSLKENTFADLTVYDVLGRTVETIFRGDAKAGNYKISYNAGHLSSGIYLYKLTTGSGFTETRKMMLIK